MRYRDFVRSLPCASCGAPGPSDGHHAIDVGLYPGMGRKAPDVLLMPLCRGCHNKLHQGNERLIQAQPLMIIQTQIKAVRSLQAIEA